MISGLVISIAFLSTPAVHAASQPIQPFTLPNTQVVPLHSQVDGQDYVLYVSLPRGYNSDESRVYPVIYTLDADYAFPVAVGTTTHFSDRGNLPPVIVVSIAYPGGISDLDSYRLNRTRDYTPSHTLKGGYSPKIQATSGGGGEFRDFITQDLFEYVQSRYRADPGDRTLVGHSFGGLFTAYVLLTRPEAFHRYIIISPSLWYDNHMIYDVAREYAQHHDDLPAKVFFGVGAYENQPNSGTHIAMADDMEWLVKFLRSQNFPHLDMADYIFPKETHNSVFPGALSRGLREDFSDWPGMH